MLDPNARCTCGYRRFREDRVLVDATISQWIQFDSGSFGGFGSTPFGTFFGTSGGGEDPWGLFDLDVSETHLRVVCESCGRIRSDKKLSSFGVYGGYVFGDSLYVYVTSSVNLGCVSVRFTNAAGDVIIVTPTIFLGTPLPLSAPAPPVTAPVPPAGAVLATVLRAVIPDVDEDGDYVATFVDSCSDTTTPIATLTLESSVQVHTPREAELDGLPYSFFVESNVEAIVPIGQVGSGSVLGIPFDKCDAVIEYDARFGIDPLTAGWQHVSSGTGAPTDYTLVDGGVLAFTIVDPSFWRKTITLGGALPSVHMFAKYRVTASTIGLGMGFKTKGIISPGALADYKGVQFVQQANTLLTFNLPGLAENPIAMRSPGSWTRLFGADDVGTDRAVVLVDDGGGGGGLLSIDASSEWMTQPGGGASPQMRAEFGNELILGGNLSGAIRNFVVSGPGRFTRAFFRSYAATTAPVLRLNFVSDLDATDPKARFIIRYGSLIASANPYAYGALSVGVTAFFNNPRNVMVEVPVTLPSLAAKQPFWFTVERDWTHGDDVTRATVHLISATVRST